MASVDFLGKVPIFAELQQEQLQSLAEKLRPRNYQRGEVIFHQDDPGDRLHIIVDGRVKISIASEDGREKDIAHFQSGECFGEMALLDGSSRSATATAVEPTETLVLLRQDFLAFFREHIEVAVEITSMLARRLRNVNQMLGDMVFLDAPTRLAKRLLELARTYAKDSDKKGPKDLEDMGPIVVPLSQDELGRLVGATRETVSRSLNSLRRQGILTASYRRIVITNLKALKRLVSQ